MCAQTRPRFILFSPKRVLGGNGVRTHVNYKEKVPSTGSSEEDRTHDCITRDCEPKPQPTELYRPPTIIRMLIKMTMIVMVKVKQKEQQQNTI